MEFEADIEVAEAEAVAKELARKERAQELFDRKTLSRAGFLPAASMVMRATLEGVPHNKFEIGLSSAGLMESILLHQGHRPEQPVALQLFNELPYRQEFWGVSTDRCSIPQPEIDAYAALGYRISKEKVLWHWETVKDWFLPAFPSALDFANYNHRFRSPLMSCGFFADQSVCFHDVSTLIESADPANALARLAGEEPSVFIEQRQNVDGSGLYDPDHPTMSAFVKTHGKVPMQITLLNDDGVMAKGILIPRPGISKLHGIDTPWFFDNLQVKGSCKNEFNDLVGTNQFVVVDNCYIGAMKVWNRRAKMPAGFEQLENITYSPEVGDDLKSLVRDGFDNLFAGGVDALLGNIANDDENLKLIIDLVKLSHRLEADAYSTENGSTDGFTPSINVLDIPMLRESLDERLQKKLWSAGQGAFINGEQLVIAIDSGLSEGEMVARGEIGKECAVWRFPTITACGLITGKLVEPSPVHLVDGKIIANTLFMNPLDVLKFQGDDDGDIVGFSTDPRIVRLWEARRNNTFYAIEPEGEKHEISTDSPEGWEYISRDPRGPVGKTTIFISRLLAVGDTNGASAVAVMNQEALDMAKRRVKYTNWAKASIPLNWKLCDDGKYHIHWVRVGETYHPMNAAPEQVDEYSENYLGLEGDFPLDELTKWVKKRLHAHGCDQFTKDAKGHALGWRIQEFMNGKRAKKRIVPSTWVNTDKKQGTFYGGNLVHRVHNYSLAVWERRADGFFPESDKSTDIRSVLPKLLRAHGVEVKIPDLNWEEYLKVRTAFGITQLGKDMAKAMASSENAEHRAVKMDNAAAVLAATLHGASTTTLATIWHYENTECWTYVRKGSPRQYTFSERTIPKDAKSWKANTPQHAFRAVTNQNSEILVLLGIAPETKCDYLDKPARTASTRLRAAVGWALHKGNPYVRLSNLLFKNVSHGEEQKDGNGEATELYKCRHCVEALQTGLVRAIRSKHKAEETKQLRELTTGLRKFNRPYAFAEFDVKTYSAVDMLGDKQELPPEEYSQDDHVEM